jgi:hypothetical protein
MVAPTVLTLLNHADSSMGSCLMAPTGSAERPLELPRSFFCVAPATVRLVLAETAAT